MAEDTDRVKRLVAFKAKLEKKVEDLASELKEQQTMLETVNALLLEKGFRHAAMPKQQPPQVEAVQEEKPAVEPAVMPASEPSMEGSSNVALELKTVSGELLANFTVIDDSIRVVPAEDKAFDVNTPPFMHFLVDRVLTKMQERDAELVKGGQLIPERIFCYNIVREGDIIREIVVKNADAERQRELRSSIRWTLEKMHEKTKGQG